MNGPASLKKMAVSSAYPVIPKSMITNKEYVAEDPQFARFDHAIALRVANEGFTVAKYLSCAIDCPSHAPLRYDRPSLDVSGWNTRLIGRDHRFLVEDVGDRATCGQRH